VFTEKEEIASGQKEESLLHQLFSVLPVRPALQKPDLPDSSVT
jgi:hypothetical protein